MIQNLQINKSVSLLLSVAFIFAFLSLNACKKDNGNDISTNSFTATIDGTAKTFNKNTLATTAYFAFGALTTIQSAAADGSVISITSNDITTPGRTYSNTASDDHNKALISYSIDGVNYVNDDSSVGNQASVTVTSANGILIVGNFTGDLVEYPTGNKKKVIISGKFNVKLNKQTDK